MTDTTSCARTGAAEPAPPRSRLRQWLGGWRVSLRMARRDIARHRWRSALIAAMIGLPVVLMVGGLIVYQTSDIDEDEGAPARFGSSQALVAGRERGVPQLIDSARGFSCVQPDAASPGTVSHEGRWEFAVGSDSRCSDWSTAAALPGLATTKPDLGALARAVSTLTGARVVPMATSQLSSQQSSVGAVHIDGADPVARGMVELTSGHWASGPDEAVVTDAGRRSGLPASGVVAGFRDDKQAPLSEADPPITIVGTARFAVGAEPAPGLILAPPTAVDGTVFLIDRSEPVTWSDLHRLASYGLVTYSRGVVLDAPEEALAATRTVNPPGEFTAVTLTTLLCLTLLVPSCLLAGPAFAVIAQRQRRTLALTAANGATRAQLRRTMLAEALVLGIATALAGAVLAMCAAWAGIAVIERLLVGSIYASDNWFIWLVATDFGPFDVPWTEVGLVLGFAMLAAVVSALVPARGLGRLDVVTALRRDVVSPRANRGVPVLGGILVVLGAALVWIAVLDLAQPTSSDDVTGPVVLFMKGGIGLVVLVVGTLLLVPIILAAVAALSAHSPVVLRMATRQVSRQRGRAVPTVAAVMAGSILLSGFALVTSTHERGQRAMHPPQAPVGQIIVWATVGGQEAVDAKIVATTPGVTLRRLGKLSTVKPAGADLSSRPLASTIVFAPPGCTPGQVLADANRKDGPPPPGATPQQRRCGGEVAGWWQVFPGGVVVATAQDASELFTLDASATHTLAAGGIVVAEPNRWVTPSLITAYTGTASVKGNGAETYWKEVAAQRGLPAAAMAPPQFVMPGMNMTSTDIRAVITPQTAAALGATATSDVIYVSRPHGMTPEDAARLATAMKRDPRYDMQLEQGYQSPNRPFQVGVYALIALLILIATLTSSALSIGEQRRDLATLGAVGAAPGMRRRLAAVQAGGLAFVGTLLGLIVGAVPGSAFSLLASGFWRDGDSWAGNDFVEVPWLVLLGVLVFVPLLAAGLAALSVPRHPDLIRRAD